MRFERDAKTLATKVYDDDGRRVCLLCGTHDGPFEDDHEPADWYVTFAARMEPIEGGRVTYNDVPIGTGQLTMKGYVTIEMCAKCNRWLGATLETPDEIKYVIMQLVTGARSLTELTSEQRRNAARWIVKTEMLWDVAIRHHPWPLPTLQFLRATGDLPMGTHVWIGQIAAEAVGGPTPQNLEPKPELLGCFPVPWGCWWVSGKRHHLRFLIADDPGGLGKGTIGLPVELGRRFMRVWPPHEGVLDWPPPVVIDRPTNEALGTVFRVVDPWPVDNGPEDAT